MTKSPLTVRHPLEKRPCPSLYQAYKPGSIIHTHLQTNTQHSCDCKSPFLYLTPISTQLEVNVHQVDPPQVDLASNRRRPCSSLMANLRRRIRHQVEIPSSSTLGTIRKLSHITWWARIWADSGLLFIICSLSVGRSYRPHVYLGCIQHLSNVSMRFLIKGVALASPFLPLPRDAVSRLHLLFGSGSLRVYRRQPHPIPRQTLVGVKSLYWPHALSGCL